MESTDSCTAEDKSQNLEELTKKSQNLVLPIRFESTEKPTYIRFLVSKALAGSLIGKGGSTITQYQDNSGAQILLSRKREYFPGTTCRIVVVSGTTKQILTALELVLGKLHSELRAEDGSGVGLRRTRFVVPHSSCGSIIGKGGATIRSFIEDSKAGIKISPLDNTFHGLSDRLVTLSGTMEEQMRAIALILTKLTEDDITPSKCIPPIHMQEEDNFNSVTIGVSDEHIGAIIGRGGSNIKVISQLSGARIKISGRGDFFLELLIGKLLYLDCKVRSILLYRL